MASILILGATGAIGQFLMPRLLAAGEQVTGLSRQADPGYFASSVQWLRGDLFGTMPPMPDVAVVYSLGPLDAFAAWFERAPAPTITRVVAFSSMSALSKRESTDPAERGLAARLEAAEASLRETAHARNIACTIFRPTLIYGTGRDRSLAPIARFAKRWRLLPIPSGADGLRQPVHAADLADACILVRDSTSTHGKTYELGGGERLRFDAMLRRIAAASPRRAWPVTVPFALVRFGARLMRGARLDGALARLRSPLIAENGPAACDFGYAPRGFSAQDVLEGNGSRAGASRSPAGRNSV